jgi:hypothetical protein
VQEHKAVRRLVKSPPELWAQCSDPASLARHLNGFGEIRITRLEPESTVAWEGESVSGTVTLEASGWGTRVQLTAVPPPAGVPAVEPTGSAQMSQTPRAPTLVVASPALASRALTARLGTLIRRRRDSPVLPAAAGAERPGRERSRGPEDPSDNAPDLVAELEAALDSLGQAHHRPYSRS